jgi:iron(II)-dependent oxidoreductase
MLAALTARAVAEFRADYRVQNVLEPQAPNADTVSVYQGHYRIGAREGVVFDNETPAQIVALSSFRIATRPVSNAEYLAFMLDGGYSASTLWSEPGLQWWQTTDFANHPWHWRQDAAGHWFDVNLNGAADLPASAPVMGISRHEAQAYANWAHIAAANIPALSHHTSISGRPRPATGY